VQADDDPYIQVLPNTGVTISVSFYNAGPEKLAAQHDIIRALLQVCPARKGSYTGATADLMNAAGMPAAQVCCLQQLSMTVVVSLGPLFKTVP